MDVLVANSSKGVYVKIRFFLSKHFLISSKGVYVKVIFELQNKALWHC